MILKKYEINCLLFRNRNDTFLTQRLFLLNFCLMSNISGEYLTGVHPHDQPTFRRRPPSRSAALSNASTLAISRFLHRFGRSDSVDPSRRCHSSRRSEGGPPGPPPVPLTSLRTCPSPSPLFLRKSRRWASNEGIQTQSTDQQHSVSLMSIIERNAQSREQS